MPENNLAAIDVGSNAMRIAIGTMTASGKFLILKKVREPVRLGHDAFVSGELSSETMARTLRAFHKFSDLMKKHKVNKYRAVATSAMRESKNSDALIQQIQKNYGIKLEIISGTEEGELIHTAVTHEINSVNKSIMMIDIGGGSVEVSFSHSGKLKHTKSFPLGTVRLIEKINKQKKKETDILQLIQQELSEVRKFIQSHLTTENPQFAVGTGGNLECLGKLKLQILKKTPNTYLNQNEVESIAQKLLTFNFEDRMEKLDLRKDRADVIIPSTLVVNELLKISGLEKLIIPYVGLRDGLLWSILS